MSIYDPMEFERACVDRLAEMVETVKDLNHTTFAKKAFGNSPSSGPRWRNMRAGRQRMYISNIVEALNALNVKPASFLFEVQEVMSKKKRLRQRRPSRKLSDLN